MLCLQGMILIILPMIRSTDLHTRLFSICEHVNQYVYCYYVNMKYELCTCV